MAITEVQRNYSAETEKAIETALKGLKAENKKESTTNSNRTTKEYSDYLNEKYAGVLKAKDDSVVIAQNLLSKAAVDDKTAQWLEYNLNLIPKVLDSIHENVARNGGRVLSCQISFDGYDSMTTQVHMVSEADPGTEEAKKLLEEVKTKSKERREEQEKLLEKSKEKKEQEEAIQNKRTKRIVTNNAESLLNKVETIKFSEDDRVFIDVRG